MSALVERLRTEQCSVDAAMQRFLDDAELYESYYRRFIHSAEFEKLRAAIACGDAASAYTSAHVLRDNSSTLGLTAFYEPLKALQTPLRVNSCEGCAQLYESLIACRDRFAAYLPD